MFLKCCLVSSVAPLLCNSIMLCYMRSCEFPVYYDSDNESDSVIFSVSPSSFGSIGK